MRLDIFTMRDIYDKVQDRGHKILAIIQKYIIFYNLFNTHAISLFFITIYWETPKTIKNTTFGGF